MQNKTNKMSKLKLKNDVLTTQIFDEESDVLNCVFNNDGCVEIKTKGYTYITLSLDNLETLKKLIIKAEKYYEKNL